ncbi:unnamed protein product [Closterium sp. NIES-54]
MEALPADEAAPETGPDEPPLPTKPTAPAQPEKASDAPRSGLDFLRATAAPVSPGPPRSTVHDSASIVTPSPTDSPRPVAFTPPPAVAGCSKDPPPPSPSPTPSTERVSLGPPSACSTPKRARSGKWAQSTLVVGSRRIPPPEKPADPPPKEAELPEEVDIPVRGYRLARTHQGTAARADVPGGDICMSYWKGNTRYAMQGDNGGHEVQAHEHTDAHKAAVDRKLKIAAGIREGQQVISDFINSDVEGRRAIRLMRSTQFLCQCDAPISMFPKPMRHLVERDTPDIPRQSYGVYLTRYGFQQMVHSISTYLTRVQMDHILASSFLGIQSDESTDRTRGKHMIVYLTFMKNRQVACEFFTSLTVEWCDAWSLFEVLLNHLRSAAVDVSKIIGISTDGASVMTGKENGLVARLREHAPHLFSCHCIAHRIPCSSEATDFLIRTLLLIHHLLHLHRQSKIIMYDTRWSGQFSWLVFGKTNNGFPYVKCSVCMAYGKENTRYARQGDDGGRDMQTQAFRAHEHMDAHKAAVDRQLKIARGIREGQQVISNFINSDVEGRRAVRLLRSVVFLCKCDAPISMYPRLMRHLAEQDTPDIPRQSYGVYLTRYGFQQMVHYLSTYLTNAQMDHINSSPFLGLQCDESTDRTRGKHMIVYLTFIMDRRVVTEFFTLLTVEKCDAASLFEVLMNHLRSAGVDVSKLVGIIQHTFSSPCTPSTCTDLGELTSYLGLRITRDRAQRTITLTHSHMVQQVLQRFGFTYSSPQSTPLPTGQSLSALPLDESVEPSGPYPELVGCLMYLMTCTRPDLAYPLSLLACYVAPGRHRKVHWDAAKRVLQYLCSTWGMGLVLGGRARVVLTGHADASWVDDLATQRSSQGYTFSLGSGSVFWRSTRSSSVLSSSCEAEIYAGAMAAQE